MHPATVLPPHNFCPGLLGQAGFFTNDVVSTLRDAAGPKYMDMQQNLLLLGLVVVIAGLLFFLAAYFRYHKKSAPLKLERSPWPAAASKNSPNRSRLFARRKRRRKGRSEILTRNPTLAETGGLPPRRPENQPPNF